MRKFTLLVIFLIGAGAAVAQPKTPASAKATGAIFISKIFPVFTSFEQDPKVHLLFANDKVLSGAKAIYQKRVENALSKCGDVRCAADSLKWTSAEIRLLGNALVRLYSTNKSLKQKIEGWKSAGTYAVSQKEPDTAILRASWKLAASGMNRIFDVYLKGAPSTYKKIDSISFAPGDPGFKKRVFELLQQLSAGHQQDFYTLSVSLAVETLKLNKRDEATRFVPLAGGMNSAPVARIGKIKWADYAYSVILVPGLGPETPGVNLDPGAVVRCKSAVEEFKKGVAPFIVVSGGNVHPFQTPFNEAVEMKKYMVEQLGVPADAVIIEPDARHTTTNLRNTNRIIYRFGMPAEKPVLIVTDKGQAAYIVNRIAAVAMRDLGYLPYKDVKKLTDENSEYYPVWNSLQVDPLDPLDP